MDETQSMSALDRESRGREWIRILSTMPSRFAGTHAERDAAERTGEWMRGLGMSAVSMMPLPAHPRAGWSLGIHTGVAALALWWGGLIGAVLAVLAAWSFRREVR